MKENENTPFDDVFKTLTIKCRRFITPFVNEMFGENHSKDAVVQLYNNEHFTDGSYRKQKKRITDSIFEIIDTQYDSLKNSSLSANKKKLYHIECQTNPDGTIALRIIEYDILIALENVVYENKQLTVTLPKTGILYLRSNKNTSQDLKIKIEASDGIAEHHVKVITIKDYTLDEIFEKKLYLLLPFFIFQEESKFGEIEENEDKLQSLKQLLSSIILRLNQLEETGKLTSYETGFLKWAIRKVTDNLTQKYKNITKGVEKTMGGQVLDLPFEKYWNDGIKQGRTEGVKQGRTEGLRQGKTESATALLKLNKLSIEEIADSTGLKISEIEELKKKIESDN